MRPLLKIITILIVAILIIFSIYVAVSWDSDESNNETDSDNDNEDDNQNDNNDTDFKDFTHNVLIEEGTGDWCKGCPKAADLLYDLYTSGNYNFYYVAMIDMDKKADKNPQVTDRLINDYNIQAWPTIFVDGGYRIAIGSERSEFEQAIRDAESRNAPQIRINLTSIYDNKTKKIETQILLENNETENYTGTLRIYLTEITSRVNNYDKKPYHYGFIDYLANEKISIAAKGNSSIAVDPYDISNLDHENLMIIASVFSSDTVKADSYPDDPSGEFNASYADATNATKLVIGGNLPPVVGINLPEVGRLHFLGSPILDVTFKNTILIGRTTISAEASDDGSIDKVEFYIDDVLKFTDDTAPYEYTFRKVKLLKRFIRTYTFTVIAYDDEGKTHSVDMDVIAFFL